MTTRRIGVAVGVLTVLMGAASARATLEIDFSGTVTGFESKVYTPNSDGTITVTPTATSVGVGSLFSGQAVWTYDINSPITSPSPFGGGEFGRYPTITFTVDGTYTYTTEILTTLGRHGAYGVTVNAIPGNQPREQIELVGGYLGMGVGMNGVNGDLDLRTAQGSAGANPFGPIETLIASDLGAFVSGQFTFGSGDYFNDATLLARGVDGHTVQMFGTVTQVTAHQSGPSAGFVANPEPTTLIPAGIAVVAAMGAAWWRRFC